ncbi:DUF2490 domain-containing protein [Chryseobacterium wanjuense]
MRVIKKIQAALEKSGKLLIVMNCFIFGNDSYAQNKEVIHQNQQWLEYTARLKMSDKYTVVGDAGFRWIDDYTTGNFYYIRAGLEYQISNISLHSGFAYLGYFFDDDRIRQVEYRPYQEMSIQNFIGKTNIYQRIRIEERFFESVSSLPISNFNRFNWRFRYMLLFDIPLFTISKDTDYRFSLGIGDEVMVNAGKNIVHNHFAQNRFLISPTLHIGKNLDVAFTWSNQYSSTFTANRFIHAQVFWLQVRQRFDFSKPK